MADRPSPDFPDAADLVAHPQFASTLANGLAVLGCFGSGAATLGNKEIAEQLGMARPTVSRLTFTLVGLGYLRRDTRTGRYSLGPAVLSLGYPLLSQLTIRQVAGPAMLELARYARGPVSMGTRDRLQVVYLETVQGQDTNDTKPDIGSTRPFLRTAIGRALLYAQEAPDRAILLKQLQKAYPEEWDKFGPALDLAFDEIKSLGFCIVSTDWRPTLAAVAVPMRGRVNGMSLAFNATVPSYSTDRKYLETNLGPRLVGLVNSIEYKLGLQQS
ncbi:MULTISPECIES: IclR family transcriptional regulator [unclassified Variovorax]|uniref:IclR family transcriptional regulator n=1 Tax=unclassified Variovorax TaxID=663243 RepID=UPI001315E189|nr:MULTISPECIES: IclR family transcriptional regulator [unclassified Variovorax]VTU17808.1 Pca regulon regulatory protein [Variovorax sp. SRS16]VTU26412.1 Pca regulon regulatory protein [Variovorax sp. PBL-E5]